MYLHKVKVRLSNMGINFQGSLNDTNERQLAFIQEILEKRGYKNTKVVIDPVGVDGDNYTANVKRVSVANESGVFKMIAKIAPKDEIMRMKANTEELFQNEHRMYTEILPKFQELEEIADIPNQDRLRFAECYGSLSEPRNEVILLEDLKTSNFTMLDRFTPLSNECVKSVLKNFAKLHSLSFALKNKEPETFKTLKSNLFDMWSSKIAIPEVVKQIQHIEQEIVSMFEGEKYKGMYKDSVVKALMTAAKLSKSDADSKHSVIQQGDSWTNNIMFRFEGDILQESIMIDYQLPKEANPTCDIHFMIFNCTDHEMRSEYFYEWIDYYHSELDKSLSYFGLKANYVYPRDQLDADLKRYAKMSFGQSVILATALSAETKDANKIKEMIKSPDKTNTLMSDLDQNYSNMLKKRLRDIADSHIKFGLM